MGWRGDLGGIEDGVVHYSVFFSFLFLFFVFFLFSILHLWRESEPDYRL